MHELTSQQRFPHKAEITVAAILHLLIRLSAEKVTEQTAWVSLKLAPCFITVPSVGWGQERS